MIWIGLHRYGHSLHLLGRHFLELSRPGASAKLSMIGAFSGVVVPGVALVVLPGRPVRRGMREAHKN